MFWIEWKNNVAAFTGNFHMSWQPWVYRISKTTAAPAINATLYYEIFLKRG